MCRVVEEPHAAICCPLQRLRSDTTADLGRRADSCCGKKRDAKFELTPEGILLHGISFAMPARALFARLTWGTRENAF